MSDVSIKPLATVAIRSDASDIKILPGGSPIPAGDLVATDQTTTGGDGSAQHPVHVIPGAVGVVVDGTTIVGSGKAGDPLRATGGVPSSFTQPLSYTVLGTEPDLSNIVIPILPSQPDGDYKATVTQGAHAAFLGTAISGKAGSQLILELSADATVGDEFDFILSRS